MPTNSRDRLSIVETCRRTQLWLRDAAADDVIAFIQRAPIPKRARKIIIDEMESYVTSSLTPAQQQLKLEAKMKIEKAARLVAEEKASSSNNTGVVATSDKNFISLKVTTDIAASNSNSVAATGKPTN